MANEKYITIPELAKLLGVSRIAIYKRVKKGQIPAPKIGRTYVIMDQTIANILWALMGKVGNGRVNQWRSSTGDKAGRLE